MSVLLAFMEDELCTLFFVLLCLFRSKYKVLSTEYEVQSSRFTYPVTCPVEQLACCGWLLSLNNDSNHRLRIRSTHMHPTRRQRHFYSVGRINLDSLLLHRRTKLLQHRVQTMWLNCHVVLQDRQSRKLIHEFGDTLASLRQVFKY